MLALAAGCSGEEAVVHLDGDPSAVDPHDPDALDRPTDPKTSDLPKSTDTPPGTDPDAPPSNPDQLHPDPPDEPVPEPAVWGTTPPLRDPLALADVELAPQALSLLDNSCSNCHSLGRPTLTRWAQLTREFTTDCLSNTELPDQPAVDAMRACFSQRAGNAAASPLSFGVYAAAARLPWFSFLFQHTPDGANAQSDFVNHVAMPRAGQPWTQAEFDVVAEWFARQLPGLFDLVPADSGEDCVPGLAPYLGSYLDQLAVTGWRAKNAQVPLLMYGCGAGQSGTACLHTLPRAGLDVAYGAGWELPGTTIRILHDNSASVSNYWSRASADGRYIGSGLNVPLGEAGEYGGQVIDLDRQGAVIAGDFAYDATFFPDNSGFLMQRAVNDDADDPGAPTSGSVETDAVAMICSQSVLAGTPAPTEITGTEPECTLIEDTFGLYQQTAKSVDGDDYWVVHGSYEGDNGGFSEVLEEPWADFGTSSTTTLTPLVNQGNGFEAGDAAQVATPHMGDPMLSPSGGLLVLRVKGQVISSYDGEGNPVATADQSGYALYSVDKSNGSASAAVHDLGRVCLTGGKATFSYDERWLVFHHYVLPTDAVDLGFSGPNDPTFTSQYGTYGSSNLMLVDLRTGAAQRITTMQPGQYALFPHFRSDGWIYFVVRTLDGEEYYAASDAALVSEAAP
ncbi:MAG: hypothetical protein ABI895_40125 [Deltaproteobacteria bacterium]